MENTPLNPQPLDNTNPPLPKPPNPLGKVVLINFLVALGYTALFSLGSPRDGLAMSGIVMFLHSLLVGLLGIILVIASASTRMLGLGFLIAGVLLFVIGFGVCAIGMSGVNFH